jgi:glutathione S-transferase
MEAAADEIFFPSVWELIREVFYKPDGQGRDAAAVAAAQAALVAHYDRLERQLGEQAYLCGEVSVADIGYFMFITSATSLGQGLTEAHPGLQAWYGRVLARPAFARELERLVKANGALTS